MKRIPRVLRPLLLFMLVLSLTSSLTPTAAHAQDGTEVAAEEATPTDTDGDGADDAVDNCPQYANPDQIDSDGDWAGDACDETPNGDPVPDPDVDADGIPDGADNCLETANPEQSDSDGDEVGDDCDDTPDGLDTDLDGILDEADNCPNSPNPDQADADADNTGDSCDETPTPEPTQEPEPEPPSAADIAVYFVAADPLSYEHVAAGNGGQYDDAVTHIDGRDIWCGDVVVFLQAITVTDGDPSSPSATIELVSTFDRRTTTGDPIGFADLADVRINNRQYLPDDPGVDDPSLRHLDGDESVSFTTWESTEAQVRASVTVGGLDFGERLVLRYEVVLACGRPASGAGGDIKAELWSAEVADGTTIDIGDQVIALRSAGEIRDPDVEVSVDCPSNAGRGRVGDEATYRVTITNTGTAELTNVAVAVSRAGMFDSPWPAALSPGQVEILTFTGAITADDAAAGVTDAKVVITTDQHIDASAETTCPLAPVAAITFNATCSRVPVGAAVGDPISFALTVENTGDAPLTGIAVVPSRVGTFEDDFPAVLPPGASETRTYFGMITQADLDAGVATDTATVTSDQGASAEGAAGCPLVQQPAISIAVGCPTIIGEIRVGDAFTYQITVENTGNVTLRNVIVGVVGEGLLDRPFPNAFAPGQTETRAVTRTISGEDAANGSISSPVNVTTDEGARATDTARCALAPAGVLALVVSATADPADSVGSGSLGGAVVFEYTVTNAGDIPLTNVTIWDDNGTDGDPADHLPLAACQVASLEAGASRACTIIQKVTLDDVKAGRVTRRAVADADQAEPVTELASVAISQHPSLEVDATTNAETADLSDVIVYTYAVRNSGDVPLTGIMLEDDHSGTRTPACVVHETTHVTLPAELGVGEVLTCLTTYVVTQADVDAGVDLVNSVRVTSAEGAAAQSRSLVGVVQNPAIDIVLAATAETVDAAGEDVEYSYIVTNTGNLTLTAVTAVDDSGSPSDPTDDVVPTGCVTGTLSPGDTVACNHLHSVTQAEIDVGRRRTTVTAIATTPNGDTIEDSDQGTVTANHDPSILLNTWVDPTEVTAAKDLTYGYLITNTGNVTLSGVIVGDDRLGPVCGNASSRTLVPGEELLCHAAASVSQAEIEAGDALVNRSTATGMAPDGTVASHAGETTVVIAPMPGPRPNPSPSPSASPAPRPSPSPTASPSPTPPANASPPPSSAPLPPLPPIGGGDTGGGGTGTFTASAGGDPLNCVDLNNPACEVSSSEAMDGSEPTKTEPRPVLEFDLGTNVSSASLDDTISYTYTLRNSGNVDLTGLTVVDDAPGTITCPETSLAAGETMTCEATVATSHTVTLADVAAGRAQNEAIAFSDQTEPVTAQAVVRINQHARLHLAQTCPVQRETGEALELTATLTNPGDVSLSNIRVVHDLGTTGVTGDDLTLTFTGGDANENRALDPGEAWDFAGSYTVGDSPAAEVATVTATATNETAGRKTENVAPASAACSTRIRWGEEACPSTYWSTHPELWDGKGTGDVTTTIWGTLPFNVTFGVSAEQSGLRDDLTLIGATRLPGDGREALARYAATALANADAGIAFPYRAGDVMALYRDATGADAGPETVSSVLAKPSAQERLRCPTDLATRHRTIATQMSTGRTSAPGGSADAVAAPVDIGASDPAVAGDAKSDGNLGGTELMMVLGALQVFGLGGLRYRRWYNKRLKRAARWR